MAKLTTLTKGYRSKLLSVKRGACKELSSRTVRRTPVDKGTLRASWTPSAGDGVDFSNAGGDFVAVCNGLQHGQSYSLGNGQQYARRIEYGHSREQAPQGMLRISVAEWDAIVARAVRTV